MNIEPSASLDQSIQGALGRKLRESWEEVVKEEVPRKFQDLLDRLKNSETGEPAQCASEQTDREHKG